MYNQIHVSLITCILLGASSINYINSIKYMYHQLHVSPTAFINYIIHQFMYHQLHQIHALSNSYIIKSIYHQIHVSSITYIIDCIYHQLDVSINYMYHQLYIYHQLYVLFINFIYPLITNIYQFHLFY